MSDPAQLAKGTREHLSAALNALQTAEDAPLALLDLAEPIAASMGVLHRIERSGGADLTGREKVLENVRKCLDVLQSMAGDHPAVDQVMESIAGSLSKASALNRAQPKAAAPAPAPAPAPVPAAAAAPQAPASAPKPSPSQSGATKTPAPRPMSTTLPLQATPQAPATPAPIPLVHAAKPAVGLSVQSEFDPTRPHPVHVEPVGAAAPQPQAQPFGMQATVPVAVQVVQTIPVLDQQAQQPQRAQQVPQPAPAPAPVLFGPPPAPPPPTPQPAQPFAAQPFAAQPIAKAAFAPQPAPAAPPSAPSAPAPRPSESGRGTPTVNVELGTRSPSNFYKGLAGNDVIEHGGIFVATYKIPAVGAAVRLRVLLPGDYEFSADATVQWTREASSADAEPGFGARFTVIGQEGRQLVYRYTRNREPIFYDDL